MKTAAAILLFVLAAPAAGAAKRARTLMPFFLDGQTAPDILALIPTTAGSPLTANQAEYGTILFDLSALEHELKTKLRAEKLQTLKQNAVTEEGRLFISMAALRATGLIAAYNDAKVELRVEIPSELRRTQTHSLFGRTPIADEVEAIGPAPWSTFVNAFSNQDFSWNVSGANAGRQPLHSEFDGALNVHDWVVESTASYTERATDPWIRGDTRLVRDFPDRMVRTTAGDLAYPLRGYQSFRPMAGVAVARNFTLQPYRLTVPSGYREIFLKSRSRVKVWMNGRFVRNLDLPPGRHDLSEFPLSNGLNDIQLEITDDTGRTENVAFRFSSDLEQLTPGLNQFVYAVGAPSTNAGSSKTYDSKNATYSVAHRYGFSEPWTLGGYAQGDRFQKTIALETLYSTQFGTFGLEPAYSQINRADASFAGRLKYLFTDYAGYDGSPRSFALQAERKGIRFAQLGNLTPKNLTSPIYSALYSQQVFSLFSLGLSGDYQVARKTGDGGRDLYGYSALLSRAWDSSLQTSLTCSRRRIADGGFDSSFFFSSRRPFQKPISTLRQVLKREARLSAWIGSITRKTA